MPQIRLGCLEELGGLGRSFACPYLYYYCWVEHGNKIGGRLNYCTTQEEKAGKGSAFFRLALTFFGLSRLLLGPHACAPRSTYRLVRTLMQVPPPGHFPAERIAGKIPGNWSIATQRRRCGHISPAAAPLGAISILTSPTTILRPCAGLNAPALIGLGEFDGDNAPSHTSQVPAAISPLPLF